MTRKRVVGIVAVWALVLAGCGGGAAGPSGAATTGSPTQAAGPTEPGPTDGAVATTGATPAATPGATSAGGGGGDGGGGADAACKLVTVDEIGGIMGESGVTIGMDAPGDISYCIYSDAAGNAVVATSLMLQGAESAFTIWKSGAGVQEIDGLGDDAVFDPITATLIARRGDRLVSITAGEGTDDEGDRLDWAKAIAEVALGRM